MKEELISFETAKLAKEKGFDWKTLYYHATYNDICSDDDILQGYSGSGVPPYNWNEKATSPELHVKEVELFSAPTQGLLQKWLREVHNIHVNPISLRNVENDVVLGYMCEIINIDKIYYYECDDKLLTYELGFEQGLFEALKLIK